MKKAAILLALIACVTGLLSACDGGGGGGNASPTQLSLSITSASLSEAAVNVPYNQTIAITASGGDATL